MSFAVWDPQLRERLRVPPTDAQAVELAACAFCGAEIGEPCVYRWTGYMYRWTGSGKSDILGQPMEAVHPQRRDVVQAARVRAARWLEQRRLRVWLLVHGQVFREDEG